MSATGVLSWAVCHPVPVSFVKVTVARRVPVDDQRDPVWVPVLPTPLKKRMAVTEPACEVENFMPSSTEDESSVASSTTGVWLPRTVYADGWVAAFVVNDQVCVPSVAPAVDTRFVTVAVTVAPLGRAAEGVKVIVVPSDDRAVEPATAEPPAVTLNP